MVTRKLLVAALLLGGCTLKVGDLSDCKVDADCASKGAGLVCLNGICVNGLFGPDSGPPDAGPECDGGGCYACTPSTYVEFLNACPAAGDVCTAFDDARLTARLPDGGRPPLPVDAGGADAGPMDAGPTDAGSMDAGAVDAGPVDAGPVYPPCDANGNPIVYISGSSAAKPFVAAMGRLLFNDTQPLTVAYQSLGSCVGVNNVLTGTPIHGTATIWDPDSGNPGNAVTCAIPTPIVTDLAVSDVFAQTCTPLPNGLPTGLADFFGPVQTMTFVVPKASTQSAISAEAAYDVFGLGAASGVAPWTDPAYLFRRNSGSGTQSMIAAAIGVPATGFQGIDTGGASGVIARVADSGNPEPTLGILGDTDVSASVAMSLKVLAYQHEQQDCAYLPDSSDQSRDKVNVRDGHYAIWGPLHVLVKVDSTGYAVNPDARRLLNYITGVATLPGGQTLIQVEADNNLVPTCAMHVTRTSEMGPYASAAVQNPCNCAFELAATGDTSCPTCSSATDCPATAPSCSYGYCEP